MTLYHHDNRDYEQAASDAATKAKAKLEAIIERGRDNAQAVIEQVMTQVPVDRIVGANALNFIPVGNGVEVGIADHGRQQLHDFALGQVAERGKVPMAYVRTLQQSGTWGNELLAHNLNQVYHKAEHTRRNYLVRSVEADGVPQVRGFLSDKYRRLDSRPILESFCTAAEKSGLVPIEGYALDTKVAFKAILPKVYEPAPHEVVCFGIGWGNSDFGNGTNHVFEIMIRLWCSNFAISHNTMRQVHIGKRISADFQFSERTYELDTKAAASAVGDLVGGLLEPGKIEERCALIKRANDENVSSNQVAAYLKKHLNKGEAEKVSEAFNAADVVNMPAGQTKWRLSNAISWVAGNMDNRARALDLMKVAHQALA